MNDREELKAFSELKGNTLLVYLCLVRNPNPIGIREVQRKLDFSSPTLAAYHLEKLENLGLIYKAPEGYVLTKEVKIGAIAQLVKFGSLILPRYIFYTVLFASLLLCYVVFVWLTDSMEFNVHSSFAFLIGLSAVAIMLYECFRIWKQRLI